MDIKKETDFCNEKKFSDFFLNHSKLLHNFIYYKCGDFDMANDLVQDSFLKFWSNCSKVLPGKAKSFLFTIANNLFLNAYSKSNVVLNFKNSLPKDYTNESPEFLLEEKEFGSKLQKAIANLTEAQRTAFLMNRIDGKKYREIAEILGISIKAVEKRIHNSLINLRKEIGNI
ncbi:MAG: RNA polymerase sigma factor [Lutibacter sp.]|uniref:RNA polymerase sigma factor n=1 Tax=Lutibacter sp. TaxID=1925666 RepID=UPI0017C4B07D|nr:RNA polymerase sigma factor [Lutibacter sp.]MBT8317735.1 RNA polymerase sigma factor [Lutibacter sp.]NNJ58593.1 RNA polymerase sigma factor [Lutibacter sp.]